MADDNNNDMDMSSIHSTGNLSLPYLHETGRKKKKKKGMGNWSELCKDFLGLIVDKLITDPFMATENIVRFRAVCRPWRSVPVDERHLSFEYPWLMLAEKEDDSDTRGFYSLSTRKVYHLNLPEARGGRRCWSSQGWLITFGLDLEIHLLNPFSRFQIRLPPQPTLPHQYSFDITRQRLRRVFIKKIILSSRPSLSDEKCVAMAICGEFCKLAFLRLGDEVWTAVDDSYGNVQDGIFFNGQFYAVVWGQKIRICDISSPHPKTVEFCDLPEGIDPCNYNYLVESLGELFMVSRYFSRKNINDGVLKEKETERFDVYKFNFDDRKLTKEKSLNNRAFFVGANTSFAIFPSDHPGCEPNCIYFTDDHEINCYMEACGHDTGLFRMEAQEIDYHYDGPDKLSRFSSPLWISPSL